MSVRDSLFATLSSASVSKLQGERGHVLELDHTGSFHGRGESESAGALSEVARHEERETKEPMTHPVNTRPLRVSSGPMNCPGAKQSQLISPHQSSGGSEL